MVISTITTISFMRRGYDAAAVDEENPVHPAVAGHASVSAMAAIATVECA